MNWSRCRALALFAAASGLVACGTPPLAEEAAEPSLAVEPAAVSAQKASTSCFDQLARVAKDCGPVLTLSAIGCATCNSAIEAALASEGTLSAAAAAACAGCVIGGSGGTIICTEEMAGFIDQCGPKIPPPPQDPCFFVKATNPGWNFKWYCHDDHSDGFAGGNTGDASWVFQCRDHLLRDAGHCPSGQICSRQFDPATLRKSGANFSCVPPSPCAQAANGNYCGNAKHDGFDGKGDPNTVYQCSAGAEVGTTRCAHGCSAGSCQSTPPPDPCANAGNGRYCGHSAQGGFAGNGDANTLYDCENHKTSSKQHCSAGCNIAPAGQADSCNASDPCAHVPSSNNGKFCGSSHQSHFAGGNPRVVYDCVNGKTASTQTCNGSCVVAPAGQDDHCP